MIYKIIIHAEPGNGYWAEVPALPGCASQGDTYEELIENIREAISGCVKAGAIPIDTDTEVLAVAV